MLGGAWCKLSVVVSTATVAEVWICRLWEHMLRDWGYGCWCGGIVAMVVGVLMPSSVTNVAIEKVSCRF